MQLKVEGGVMPLPHSLCRLLPRRLVEEICVLTPAGEAPEEIRLRRRRRASLTLGGENLLLSCVLTDAEMDALLLRFCNGSLYAYADTLACGYLPFEGGVRIGVGGNADVRDGRVCGVCDVDCYVIRLPSPTPATGEEICALLAELHGVRGVLIYAPPGVGKTTLLRAVAARMASPPAPKRVVVVDTRREFSALAGREELLLDILHGYPRGVGIAIAARTLGAQLIVCDEVGDLAEAQEILHAHAAGVPLLTSAHAADVEGLLSRPGLRALHEAGCFGAYVGIQRSDIPFRYRLDVTRREAVCLH